MSVFISWSGARSQVLAKAMQEWLPKLVGELAGEIEVFHSDDISKGQNWHSALIEKLQKCRVGVFCITPESLRSQWMLFEAGVLSRHDKQSRLFAYLYGTDQL